MLFNPDSYKYELCFEFIVRQQTFLPFKESNEHCC